MLKSFLFGSLRRRCGHKRSVWACMYLSLSVFNLVELGKASPMTVFKQAYLYVILSQLSLCAF